MLLLWRWSTAVQFASVTMIAAFFIVLARGNPRAELRWWSWAWAANFSALVSTIFYWYFQPDLRLTGWHYVASKSAFVLLFVQGGLTMVYPGRRLMGARTAAVLLLACLVLSPLLLGRLEVLGIVQHAFIAAAFILFLAVLARAPSGGLTWLAVGLAVRALLALVEVGAYVLQVLPEGGLASAWRPASSLFLSASSSFDVVAEWLLVLGSVVAVADRSQRELRGANRELLAAQEDLRRLADRDPLTALPNRRVLPEVFRAVQPHGATILFFDLDGFKQINDRHGHLAGDACLKHFAAALREAFRPEDHVVRYAGDEFAVVARGLDPESARMRVEDLRFRLRRSPGSVAYGFSVGLAELPAGGHPDAALQAADAAMYDAKSRRAQARSGRSA